MMGLFADHPYFLFEFVPQENLKTLLDGLVEFVGYKKCNSLCLVSCFCTPLFWRSIKADKEEKSVRQNGKIGQTKIITIKSLYFVSLFLCILYFVFYILFFVFFLLYFFFCILSFVFCLLYFVFCLLSCFWQGKIGRTKIKQSNHCILCLFFLVFVSLFLSFFVSFSSSFSSSFFFVFMFRCFLLSLFLCISYFV